MSPRGVSRSRTLVAAVLLACASVRAQAQTAPEQTQADDYTRYELLDPSSQQFRIVYDVTATTPGAAFYFNVIRKGSVASDESVVDPVTGRPLAFEEVSGKEARASGHPTADLDTNYIRVRLARPVPPRGEARVRILKTYKDAKSYYQRGDAIVFDRPLGIKRNAVVLPRGYALVSCNMPSQVWTEADGRVGIGFFNTHPDAVSLVLTARPLPPGVSLAAPPAPTGDDAGRTEAGARAVPTRALERAARAALAERGAETREVTYTLGEPASHTIEASYDLTESRPGTSRHVSGVSSGSRVTHVSATDLDSGETLQASVLSGAELAAAGLEPREVGTAAAVVVVRFPALAAGATTRLRVVETFVDAGRFGVVDGELVWQQTLDRARNAVVLPQGWTVTFVSAPATVTTLGDGRVRLDVDNPNPGGLDVVVRARAVRRRPAA